MPESGRERSSAAADRRWTTRRGDSLSTAAAWSTVLFVLLEALDSFLGNRITIPWPVLTADAAVGAALVLTRHRLGTRPFHPWLVVAVSAVSTATVGLAALAAVDAAAARRWRTALPLNALFALALLLVVHVPWSGLDPVEPLWVQAVLIAVAVLALTALSAYRAARRELVQALRDRAADLEREQRTRVERARAEERNEIAREMHDVLAHRLSLIALNSSVLAERGDLPPEESGRLVEDIHVTAKTSLAELRGILSGLRAEDTPTAPQPTFDDLPALLADNRRAGVDLAVRDEVSGRHEVPPTIGRHALRIVQEALTNARRHGAPGVVTVAVTGGPGRSLALEVVNPVADRTAFDEPADPGVGLIGLTERVAICGGSLRTHRADDRFHLRAALPWPA